MHRVDSIRELFSSSWEERWENSRKLSKASCKTAGYLPKQVSSSWSPLIPPPAVSVSLCRFGHLSSLIHFQPSRNFRNSMQICSCLGWLLQGLSYNWVLSIKVSVSRWVWKMLWGLSWHWEMLTLSWNSYVLHPCRFDLHCSSCVFGCINVLLPRHNPVLLVVVNHLCLQILPIFSLVSCIYPVSLVGSWGKTSFPRCTHWFQYPENRFHWHGPSLAQSVWSPLRQSCQTDKMTFPEGSVFAAGPKGFTGSKSQAERRLLLRAGTGVECQDPRAGQVKYSVDTANEIWVSGSYSRCLMSLLKYSS